MRERFLKRGIGAAASGLFAAALLATPARAADVDIHGFLLGTGSARVSSVPLPTTGEKRNWLVGETRLRVDLTADSRDALTGLVAKVDVVADGVDSTADIDVRELYGEYRGRAFEIRAGRQMLTWGVADRLFINDIFPKNWSAFYSGKPLEYMKIGSDMVKVSYFARSWDAELALIPFARVDTVPIENDRFFVFSPAQLPFHEPSSRLSNGEAALRLHTRLGSTDVALYAFRGFWHQPDKGVSATTGRPTFPRLNNYGLTLQDTLLGGVASLELGFYQSADDTAGTDPRVANSQYRYLLAYEREVMRDVTVALQYYGEIMDNHTAYAAAAWPSFQAGLGPRPLPEHRKMGTVRVRALWLNQTLTTSVFAMATAGGGRMVNPDIHYAVTDEFSINGGAFAFWGGPDTWMLGMMKHDDNVYINAKWTF